MLGPSYNLYSKNLELVIHRAFANATEAKEWMDTFAAGKEHTSLVVLPLHMPIVLTMDPSNMSNREYQTRICNAVIPRIRNLNRTMIPLAPPTVNSGNGGVPPQRWGGDNGPAAGPDNNDQKIHLPEDDEENEEDGWFTNSNTFSSSSSSSSSSSDSSSSSSSSSSSPWVNPADRDKPFRTEAKWSSLETFRTAGGELMSLSEWAKKHNRDPSETASSGVSNSTPNAASAAASGRPSNKMDTLLSVPWQLANPTQNYALIQCVPRINLSEPLVEPIVWLQGLFASEAEAGSYAATFMDKQSNAYFCPDLVTVLVGKRICPAMYRRKDVLNKVIYPGRDKHDRMAQAFQDGRRESKQELLQRANEQARFDQLQRTVAVESLSAGTSQPVEPQTTLVPDNHNDDEPTKG